MAPTTSKTKTGKTNPIRNRERWSIGSSEKFISFDWRDNGDDGTVTVHSAVCSNERGMLADFLRATVPVGHAENEAREHVAKAWEWVADKKNALKMKAKERRESVENGEAFIKDIKGAF